MARAQNVKRRQQLFRAFLIDENGQQHNQRSPFTVCRDELERMWIRRLDHLGLNRVQSLECRFDMIATTAGCEITLDPSTKHDESRIVASSPRGGKQRERSVYC